MIMPEIFISHRATDADIADMLLDFLTLTGIERSKVFCSSLPGNDVKEKISIEVKSAIKESVINIVILSEEYNKSAYCLNEAGIIWFQDVTTIVIALPEILPKDMVGFLNSDYKLRRLDNDDDIAAVHDGITTSLQSTFVPATVLTKELSKFKKRYNEWIKNRKTALKDNTPSTFKDITTGITTNDERIVLYYMMLHNLRKVRQESIEKWLIEEEVYDVNIENAFDLLSTIGSGVVNEKNLEIDIDLFRQISSNYDDNIKKLSEFVENHRRQSKSKFEKMWELGQFDGMDKLFIAYIVDERVFSFGSRWMADTQVEHIKDWERKYSLENKLSLNYENCLSKFIDNNFIFESGWTSYGNPREYKLHKSLKEFLFDVNVPYKDELNKSKKKIYFDIPF